MNWRTNVEWPETIQEQVEPFLRERGWVIREWRAPGIVPLKLDFIDHPYLLLRSEEPAVIYAFEPYKTADMEKIRAALDEMPHPWRWGCEGPPLWNPPKEGAELHTVAFWIWKD